MRSAAVVLAAAGLSLSGCVETTVPAKRRAKETRFQCRSRVAGFERTQGAKHDGVVVACTGTRPFIRRWVQTPDRARRLEVSHSLTPAQFSSLWMQVGGTGWYRVHTCAAKASDDVKDVSTTTFRVRQGRIARQLSCRGKTWPPALSRLHKILVRAGRRYAPWAGARMPRNATPGRHRGRQ